VNPPIGKGKPPPGPVKPLIAIPTTAGTGSETTGVSIFDLEELHAKTGIAHRTLRPILGIVDPLNTNTLPPNVAAFSGFDVLSHSLESYTAIPYNTRPKPERPILRPSYQGSNPISDYWSIIALELTSKYIERSYKDPSDFEARSNMLLASTYAGIGFGNAGVHLCHGMSYPVSGLAHKLNYHPKDYDTTKSIIPHGMSVIMHAPAVFKFTSSSNPERHLFAARKMGANTDNVQDRDAGNILVEKILELMRALNIPNGLSALGFNEKHIDSLVEGTLPQHRVTKLSPRPVQRQDLSQLFKESMTVY
jgi:hydroxyacid-oxoacid transhydrogenase